MALAHRWPMDATDRGESMPMRSEPAIPRVLIADDQPDVLEALRLLLKGEGYKIESAGSPAAILESIDGDRSTRADGLNYARIPPRGRGLDLLSKCAATIDLPVWRDDAGRVECGRSMRRAREDSGRSRGRPRAVTILRPGELARAPAGGSCSKPRPI